MERAGGSPGKSAEKRLEKAVMPSLAAGLFEQEAAWKAWSDPIGKQVAAMWHAIRAARRR